MYFFGVKYRVASLSRKCLVTTKKKFESTSPFQLEIICFYRSIGDGLRILGGDGQIITVDCNVLIVISTILLPNVRLGGTRNKTHISKYISKAFVPSAFVILKF